MLTARQIEQYERDGFCGPIDVMSPDEAAACRTALETAESRYPDHIGPENRNDAHYVFRVLDGLVHHPGVVSAAADIAGPDLLVWSTVLFVKEPRTPGFVSWHQDFTYTGIEPHLGATAWIALSPSTTESGCMHFIPGSHRNEILPHRDTFDADNILTRGQVIDGIDESAAVPVEMRPGQMTLHHTRTIHGSSANLSDDRRIGFAIQAYMPPEVRQTKGWDTAQLVRGRDRHGHFRLGPRPEADMCEAGLAFRALSAARMSEILYDGADEVRAY